MVKDVSAGLAAHAARSPGGGVPARRSPKWVLRPRRAASGVALEVTLIEGNEAVRRVRHEAVFSRVPSDSPCTADSLSTRCAPC